MKEVPPSPRYAFEVCQRDQQKIIFKTESIEEKNDWMAALVMLNTKSMLERTLDVILSDEEKQHPLRLPDNLKYRSTFRPSSSRPKVIFQRLDV